MCKCDFLCKAEKRGFAPIFKSAPKLQFLHPFSKSTGEEIIYVLEEYPTCYRVEKYEYFGPDDTNHEKYLPKGIFDLDRKLEKAGYRELSEDEYIEQKMIIRL